MARMRMIKPDYSKDTAFRGVSIWARFLYCNIWCHLDCCGVCEYDLGMIKIEIFPWDKDITEDMVSIIVGELCSIGKLVIVDDYDSNKKYLFCPTFKKHQYCNKHENPRFDARVYDICDAAHKSYPQAFCKKTDNGERITDNGVGQSACTDIIQVPYKYGTSTESPLSLGDKFQQYLDFFHRSDTAKSVLTALRESSSFLKLTHSDIISLIQGISSAYSDYDIPHVIKKADAQWPVRNRPGARVASFILSFFSNEKRPTQSAEAIDLDSWSPDADKKEIGTV